MTTMIKLLCPVTPCFFVAKSEEDLAEHLRIFGLERETHIRKYLAFRSQEMDKEKWNAFFLHSHDRWLSARVKSQKNRAVR